ncbi:MAG: hypothetical protein ACE5LU_11595 [Anaerolineae bacterium]
MEKTHVPSPVRYLVEEDGRRVGVVLTWEDYQDLQASVPADPDVLPGLNETELQALAEGMLSSPHQGRLDDLLQRNREEGLSPGEKHELDHQIEYVDSMNVLKARAMYTLQRRREANGY